MSSLKALRFWVPVFLYTFFIFWISSAPRDIPPTIQFPAVDKVLHMLEYLPLGVFAVRAAGKSLEGWPMWKVHLAGLLWVILVASSDEIYQKFIPMRISSPFDAAADILGAAAGQILWRIDLFFSRKRT